MTVDPSQPARISRRRAPEYLSALSRRSPLEGTQFGGVEATTRTATALADPAVRQAHLDRLSRAFAKADGDTTPADSGTVRARDAVLRDADRALAKLGRERGNADLDQADRTGLEAVIRLTGRPSILVKNGDLDLDLADPDLGPWQGTIVLARDTMKATIRSVGRIDRDGVHIGTGFVVAPGVVMTNRHVVQEIAHRNGGTGQWSIVGGTATIDFAREYGSDATASFVVTGVIFAGPVSIGDSMDLGKLDLALLSVETTNDMGEALPGPLPLSKNLAGAKAMTEVYMVGYPARPATLPAGGSVGDQQLVDTLRRVFRMRYGFKRLALGSIIYPLGQVPDDSVPWAIGHDATTLGGNSGSCVVGLNDEGPVMGLHFGGIFFDHNLAHVLAAIPALQASPAAVGFDWR